VKLLSRLFGNPAETPPVTTAEDPPAAVVNVERERLEAIGKLPDGDVLRELAGVTSNSAPQERPSATEQRAAQARFAQLVDSGAVDLKGFPLEALAPLVVDGSTSRLRQLAAEAVQDPVQLRELLKQVRTKDKNVFKILKQKLDALHARDREAAAIVEEINSIGNALERHSHRVFDPLYTGVFEHHHHRWLNLTTPPNSEQTRVANEAIGRCQGVIAEHALQVSRQAEQQAAQMAALEAQRLAQEAARAEAAASAQVKSETEALLREEAAAARNAEDALRAERVAAEDHLIRQIGGLLRKANAELTEGRSQSAAGLRRAIDEKLTGAPAVPGHLAKGLQQLDARLNELKQWKSFAVTPKRAELIRDMESLIGSTEEPKVLAERIKALQEDWKTISKGLVSDGSEDWERFHQAAQKAYQPCREYFEAQAKQRQENLKRRQTVLDRVRAVESGALASANAETPDWRLLASVLREAPLEWRSHSPVERDAGRALQAEFDASLARLQETLDAWYERNVADKQTLIQKARHLLNLDDGREATDAVKRLQVEWKEIGPAPREREQALWHEFRQQCDAIFQKRQQAHQDFTARLEAGKTQAIALCAEVEQAAAQSGPALLEANANVSGWRAAFEALVDLPRTEARALQRRFEQAIGNLETQGAQQRSRDAQKSLTDVFEAIRLVRACEWAAIQALPDAERQSLRQQADEFLAGLKRGPGGTNQAIKDALAKADSAGLAAADAREKALRTLCIRCEILSETPTPAEDESLRREYQVQRLMQGLGQGALGSGDWNAMLLEWIRVSAIAPALHASLQSRFMHSWLQNAAGSKRPAEPGRRDRYESRARS
jgi:Domain of Unknown Function (DUF349)